MYEGGGGLLKREILYDVPDFLQGPLHKQYLPGCLRDSNLSGVVVCGLDDDCDVVNDLVDA